MKLILALSLVLALCASVTAQSPVGTHIDPTTGRQMSPIFTDEFDELDMRVWEPEITMSGGGNWEFEMYVNNRSNAYVNNSILYMKPTLTSDKIGEANLRQGYTMDLWGMEPNQCTSNAFYGCLRASARESGGTILNPIQSSRLRTVNSFSFKYGKLETRARLPQGDWLWPAIWLLPKNHQYGPWPASGEIDLMESRGNSPETYPAGGNDQFGSTLHWGPYYPQDTWPKTHAVYNLPNRTFVDDFHIFGLVWSNESIITYLDDPSNVVLNVTFSESFFDLGGYGNIDNPWAGRSNAAPFDTEFYIIMNVAVGGLAGYFPDGIGGKTWSNGSPTAVNDFWDSKDQWYPTWTAPRDGNDVPSAMQVDYMRVWGFDD